MGVVVDGVRVVELAVVPQHLAWRRVGLGHGEHPLRVAALRHQLPAGGGRGGETFGNMIKSQGTRRNFVGRGSRRQTMTWGQTEREDHMTGHVTS